MTDRELLEKMARWYVNYEPDDSMEMIMYSTAYVRPWLPLVKAVKAFIENGDSGHFLDMEAALNEIVGQEK